jgi:hypothetical protein
VPRRLSGRKKDEITGCLRTFHSEELLDLYFSSRTIRTTTPGKGRWAEYIISMKERISASKGKCSLAISTHRWEDSIRIAIR